MQLFFPERTRFLTCAVLFILVQSIAFAQKGESAEFSPAQTGVSQQADPDAFEWSFPALGTIVQLTVYAQNREVAERAFQDAEQMTRAMSAVLSDYDPQSEARRISQLAAVKPMRVSETLWEALQAADSWNRLSDGKLDCSLGALTSVWRKYRRANRVPAPSLIEATLMNTGWHGITFDHEERTVSLANDRIRFDFGAIGKGFIVDRLYELMRSRGLDSCLINISGNMRLGSAPPGRDCWRIAISPLEPKGEPLRRLALSNVSIATSGDLWQYTVVDGKKQSHILDPATGYGVEGPLAVTVICPNAIDADALATIGCIQPWCRFTQLLQRAPGATALRAARLNHELRIEHSADFPEDYPDFSH